MSLFLYIGSGLFLLYQFIAVIERSETEFMSAKYVVNSTEMIDRTMQDFDDSFNMLLNIRLELEEFDWFNNPYISPNIYDLNGDWHPKLSNNITLRLCKREDLIKFMPAASVIWHENALCFNDKKLIQMYGDWYDEKFQSIFISIDYCNQKFYNGTCKSKPEIDDFLK